MAGLTSYMRESCTLAVLLANNHNAMSRERDIRSNETTDDCFELEDEADEPYDLSMPKLSHNQINSNEQSGSEDCKYAGMESATHTINTGEQMGIHSSSPTCASSMLQEMNDMRQKRILCDLIFCVDSKEFYAHKAVMASCSEFCRERFLADHRLAQENVTTINLDVPSNGLSVLLDYVYTDKLDIDKESVWGVIQAAKKLRIGKLTQACQAYREEQMLLKEEIKSFSSSSECSDSDARGQVVTPDASLRDLCKAQTSSPEMHNCGTTIKPRCLSDSTQVTIQERLKFFESEALKSTKPVAGMNKPFPYSKSEGEASYTDAEKTQLRKDNEMGSRSSSTSGLLNDSTLSEGLYQPIHWKHQFIGRHLDSQVPHLQTYSDLSSSASDEVFQNTKTDDIPKKSSEPPTIPFASSAAAGFGQNSTHNYFTYNFNTRQNQIRSMFGMPGYPDFNGINPFTSLFAYQLGANTPLDNHFSHFRSRVQSHDPNGMSRLNRELYPLLSSPTKGDIAYRHRAPALFNSAEPIFSHKSNFDSFSVNDRSIKPSIADTAAFGNDKRRRKANSAEYYLSPTKIGNSSVRKYSSSDKKTSPIIVCGDSSTDSGNDQLPNSKHFKKGDSGKPYKCPLCDASFNRPANLKTHMRIHSGEKPYKCDTCGARFVQVAHLRAHVLIHTGEKPYPCNVCGTRFRHLQTLKSHLRIHTGEKPYSCEQCSVQFRHKSQLRLHLRTKHGIQTNTKKTYKQVPGLCSADICAHIKRAQEAVKTQSFNKFDEMLDSQNNSTIPARNPKPYEVVDGEKKFSVETCSSDDMTASPKSLSPSVLYKISVHGRLGAVSEFTQVNAAGMSTSRSAGMNLTVV